MPTLGLAPVLRPSFRKISSCCKLVLLPGLVLCGKVASWMCMEALLTSLPSATTLRVGVEDFTR